MKKLLVFFLFINIVSAQTIADCRQRFNRYLNFRNSLNSQVQFGDDVIYVMDNGKKYAALYADELPALSVFFKNSTLAEQQKLMRSKGMARLSKTNKDSLLTRGSKASTDTSKLPLKGYRIAIDPGHFGTTLAEAQVEQKFLYFVDPLHKQDTVKLFESSLTFNTATLLKSLLEEQGATIMLSRDQSNFTSFNCTFDDWMKRHKKRSLDSLVSLGSMTAEKQRVLLKCTDYKFFWDFFRDYDLANRAHKVNAFKPDITIIIHYNVDEKNVPWKAHTTKNFSMAFIGGGFTGKDLGREENKMHFIRLLITDQLNDSEKLAAATVMNFHTQLGITIARPSDATYLQNNCIATASPGVFCRNLVLCRKINSPLVYGESLYQDNEKESALLMRSDLDLYGIKTNERLKKVAISYYEAIIEFIK